MKSFKASIIAIITLAALSIGASASAGNGTLKENVASENGTVFTLATAISVQKVAGAVEVRGANSTLYTHPDTTGSVFNKIVASPLFASKYVQVAGTTLYYNLSIVQNATCYGSPSYPPQQTALAYPTAPVQFIPDNCAFLTKIQTLTQ